MRTIKASQVAQRIDAWTAQQGGVTTIKPDVRFTPSAIPAEFQAGRGGKWAIPGAKALARPIQTAKGKVAMRRDTRFVDAFQRTGLIFVHVPKNAGSAVAKRLYGDTLGHRSALFYRSTLPRNVFDAHVSFAILRDPRRRIASAFSYLKFAPILQPDIDFRDRWFEDVPDFGAFVDRLQDPHFRAAMLNWPHFRDQCQFVADMSGALCVDYVFSMDRMDTVKAFVDAVLGETSSFDKKNASPETPLTDVDWGSIDDLYRHDQALFEMVSASPSGVMGVAR